MASQAVFSSIFKRARTIMTSAPNPRGDRTAAG
jgi:hypothetical protein